MSTASVPRDRASYAREIVLEYLRKHGYRSTEKELLEESAAAAAAAASAEGGGAASVGGSGTAAADAAYDDESRNAVMLLDRASDGYEQQPQLYEEMYAELREWVDGSLDLYRGELHAVLYPMLVHCFIEMVRRSAAPRARRFLERYGGEFVSSSPKRARELRMLMGLSSPQHLAENDVAKLFLQHRYELYLSAYALELLLAFLTDNPRRYLLLWILNHKCRVVDHTLSSGSGAADGVDVNAIGFFASHEQSVLLQREVLWGVLKENEYVRGDDEDEGGGAGGDDAPSGESGIGGGGGGGGGGTGGDAKAAAPATADGAAVAAAEDAGGAEASAPPAAPHLEADNTLSASMVPLPRYRRGTPGLEQILRRVASRAALSTESPPSVLCYTLANTAGCALNCASTSPDGGVIVGGLQDSSVRVWDYKASGAAAEDGNGAAKGADGAVKLVGHCGPVYAVDMSFCGRYVLSGSEDGSVRLWSVALQADLVAYRGHNHPVWSVAWSPLGHYFASGGHDGSARVWSTDRIAPLRVLAGHLSDVDAVRWHPNCNYVASGSNDATARLWDVRTGDCVRVFGTHSGALHTLAFSPNGRYLAMSGQMRDIHVWDVAEGKQVQQLRGHDDIVWSLAYSQEGSVLASSSADNTVRVWNAQLGVPADSAGGASATTPAPAAPTTATDTSAAAAKPRATPPIPGVKPSSSSLVCKLRTKRTPIYHVQFTRKNLLIAVGAYGC